MEPTTGLHFADIQQLLDVLHQLRDQGNTIVVIEHNLDVIKTADWIVDLGPEGGSGGGEILVSGTPETVAECEASHGPLPQTAVVITQRLSGLQNMRIKLVGRIRRLRRIRQQLCLMALRLSGLQKLQNQFKACRPDKIACAASGNRCSLMALRLSGLRNYRIPRKACRPDKALAPHPAAVMPDGATLIRPTKLQNTR